MFKRIRNYILTCVIAAGLGAHPLQPAFSQGLFSFTLAPQTVVGNIRALPGPGQQIPINSLFSNLTAPQNTVKGAATSTPVTDLPVPSCSGVGSTLQWTTNVGFGCAISGLPSVPAFDTFCNPTSSTAAPVACQYGVLHSKDVGATGNGSTDDTTALQNWINACQTNKLVCHLDSGTYKTTSALTCTPPLVIEGDVSDFNAAGISIINPANGINTIVCTGTAAVTFRDFTINYAATQTAGAAISLTASGALNANQGSHFERVGIQNAFVGYNIGQAFYFTISNNTIQGTPANGSGVFLDNTGLTNTDQGDSTIEGSSIFGVNSANGITISSYAGLRIINNKINGNFTSGTGILLNQKNAVTGNTLLMIVGNSLENNQVDIQLQRAGASGDFTNVIIANNEFEMLAAGAAVNNPTDTAWLKNVIVTGNLISGPGTTTGTFGYIFKAATGVQISNNFTKSNSTTNGFQNIATTGSTNCVIGMNGHGTGLFAADDVGCVTMDNLDSWVNFSPAPSCGSATFTINSARARRYRTTTEVTFDMTITALGTCNNAVTINLPFTANNPASINGAEIVSNNTLACHIVGAMPTTALCIMNGGAAYAVNNRLIASGVYENQ